MNNKKNTGILSIFQNRYRRESTISVPAPLEDVRKTFEAISKTGLYVQYLKFNLRCNGRIIEVDWSRWGRQSIELLTKITLEQRLDGNGTTLNLTTQIAKGQIVRKIISVFLCDMIFVYVLNCLKLDYLSILYTMVGFTIIDFISIYFDISTDLLVKHFQKDRVWNGLGSHKPPIHNPWIWREKK